MALTWNQAYVWAQIDDTVSLQSSWDYNFASLIAQPVKNPPAMQETPTQSLGREDLLEKG